MWRRTTSSASARRAGPPRRGPRRRSRPGPRRAARRPGRDRGSGRSRQRRGERRRRWSARGRSGRGRSGRRGRVPRRRAGGRRAARRTGRGPRRGRRPRPAGRRNRRQQPQADRHGQPAWGPAANGAQRRPPRPSAPGGPPAPSRPRPGSRRGRRWTRPRTGTGCRRPPARSRSRTSVTIRSATSSGVVQHRAGLAPADQRALGGVRAVGERLGDDGLPGVAGRVQEHRPGQADHGQGRVVLPERGEHGPGVPPPAGVVGGDGVVERAVRLDVADLGPERPADAGEGAELVDARRRSARPRRRRRSGARSRRGRGRPRGPRSRRRAASAVRTVRVIVAGSPAWNPQATFALVTVAMTASSSPSSQRPKPSPTSAFRSSRWSRRSASAARCAVDR